MNYKKLHYLSASQMAESINTRSQKGEAFFFMINFEGSLGFVLSPQELSNYGISCSIEGEHFGISPSLKFNPHPFHLEPPSFKTYKKAFEHVMHHIVHGDSYLLNLTMSTEIIGALDFEDLYSYANAKYKFLLHDQFLFYSPEPFIRIQKDKIYSYPMKGTISALLENAEQQLLSNAKELREHFTIVDLIRNDLSLVSSHISVDRFRYIETIQTPKGHILQTSSQISGQLPLDWKNHLGDILFALIPAGSISGAPKSKTMEIIHAAEINARGFYTGIMGYFDGNKTLNSCVAIRYIEKKHHRFFYRSGGGITSQSIAEDEYQELITKIYVPTS